MTLHNPEPHQQGLDYHELHPKPILTPGISIPIEEADYQSDSGKWNDSRQFINAGPSYTMTTDDQTTLITYRDKLPNYAASIRTHVHWWALHPAWSMYGFLLMGMAFAIGHHHYYKSVDGHPANDQSRTLRYGTLLAFMTKASFVWAAVTAFRQRVWTTVRTKPLTLKGLDTLFAAADDLLSVFHWELWRKAKLAILLAIYGCQALSIEPTSDVTTCAGPKSLNFSQESIEDWRTAEKDAKGYFGLSASLWNSTTAEISSRDWYDYYTGPSPNLEQVAMMAIFGQRIVAHPNASSMACGGGWDCKYDINFVAPGYKCAEVMTGTSGTATELHGNKPPFSTAILLPQGIYSYYAVADRGDYAIQQMNESEIGGMPKIKPPFPKNIGAFRTEPIVWIGHSVRKINPPPNNRSMPGWDDAFTPRIFGCENYETQYTVSFSYLSGVQKVDVKDRKYLRRINTTLTDEDANDGTASNVSAIPLSGYVFPGRNMEHYRYVAAYHSLGSVLRRYLNGTLNSNTTSIPIQNTLALQTKVLNPLEDWFPYPDLMDRISSMFEDIVFSLFSNSQFLPIVWAAKPDTRAGNVQADDSTLYPCTRSKPENRFRYHPLELWTVYGASLILAIGAVTVGTISVIQNQGVLRNTRYSSIATLLRYCGLEYEGLHVQDGRPAG